MQQQPTTSFGIFPTTGGATTADVVALAALQDYVADDLVRVRTRAEKWIGGLAALVGVLTTALVIKGKESFTDLVDRRAIASVVVNPKSVVTVLMLLGGIALAAGIYNAYSAAHGNPAADDALLARAEAQQVEGAYAAWAEAVRAAATASRSSLHTAVVCTLGGMILLTAALIFAWTTDSKESGGGSFCVRNGSDVVELAGAVPTVSKGQIVVVPCPPS